MLLTLVDTVLILSTFKMNYFLSMFILILNIEGCSYVHINQKEKTKEPAATSAISLEPHGAKNALFLDKSEEYGLSGIKGVHFYAVDFNNDGYTDLVVLEDFLSSPKFYYFDSIQNKFILKNNPFKETIHASFLNFVDIDHDGILDIIVGNLNQKNELTKRPVRIFKGRIINGEISYTEAEGLPIAPTPASSVSVIDFDLDGEIDLFISHWYESSKDGLKIIPNYLLKGKGFHFENVSEKLQGENDYQKSANTFLNARPTFGSTICDVNKDGFPDILTNSSNGFYNKMWLSSNINGEIQFKDIAIQTGYAADDEGSEKERGGGNSFFSLCGDYNNDGIVDLVVGNAFKDSDPESRDRSAVLTGASTIFPSKYIRSEFYFSDNRAKWSETDRRGLFADFFLTGREDLIIENSGHPPDSRLVFFEQLPDHEYVDNAALYGMDIVNPSGAVVIDLKKRGVLDLIVGQSETRINNGKTRIYVFENQTKRGNKTVLRLHPEGRRSNSHAISGTLEFFSNNKSYFRNIVYNYGSLPSQNEEGLFIALPENEIPDHAIIRWPIISQDDKSHLIPLIMNYDFKKMDLKGKFSDLNLCEDGRILKREKHCY